MMRNKASSSMQKTYDECYLVCSTAVYFEGQVRSSTSSLLSIDCPADHRFRDRITKQKRYDHGVRHSIRSTTTMPTGSRRIISQNQRPRERCRNHSGIWSCNARNVSIFWMHSERVARTPKTTETGRVAARQHGAGHRYLPKLILLRNIKQIQGGLERVQYLQ